MDARNQIDIPDPEDAGVVRDWVREFEFPEERLAWEVIRLAVEDLSMIPSRLESDYVTTRVSKLENHISAATYLSGDGFKEDAELLNLDPGFMQGVQKILADPKIMESVGTAYNERADILKKAGGGTRLAELTTTKMADFLRGPTLSRKQSLFSRFGVDGTEPDPPPLTPNFGRGR